MGGKQRPRHARWHILEADGGIEGYDRGRGARAPGDVYHLSLKASDVTNIQTDEQTNRRVSAATPRRDGGDCCTRAPDTETRRPGDGENRTCLMRDKDSLPITRSYWS